MLSSLGLFNCIGGSCFVTSSSVATVVGKRCSHQRALFFKIRSHEALLADFVSCFLIVTSNPQALERCNWRWQRYHNSAVDQTMTPTDFDDFYDLNDGRLQFKVAGRTSTTLWLLEGTRGTRAETSACNGGGRCDCSKPKASWERTAKWRLDDQNAKSTQYCDGVERSLMWSASGWLQ